MVLPFGPELFHHKPIHVAEPDLLQVSRAAVGREQVFAVGVGVAEDVADLAADRGNPALEILTRLRLRPTSLATIDDDHSG